MNKSTSCKKKDREKTNTRKKNQEKANNSPSYRCAAIKKTFAQNLTTSFSTHRLVQTTNIAGRLPERSRRWRTSGLKQKKKKREKIGQTFLFFFQWQRVF